MLRSAVGTTLLTQFITHRKQPRTRFKMRVSVVSSFLDRLLHFNVLGVSELSDRDEFTGRDSLYEHINDRFRRLLVAARPYLDTFEEFRASVVDNEEEVISQLTQVSFWLCLFAGRHSPLWHLLSVRSKFSSCFCQWSPWRLGKSWTMPAWACLRQTEAIKN